jgi:hypothetical protein
MVILRAWLAWANVPFLSALGIAVLFAALQATGLLGLLAGGDHDGDGDADHDVEHGAGHDSDGPELSLFGLLGVGRVPLTFALQTFAISFGVGGLSITTLAFGALPPPTRALLWALPAALALAAVMTGIVSRVAGRIFSTEGQEPPSRAQLVGASGVVISTRVDDTFGEVRLSPIGAQPVRVVVTTRDEEPIPEGREIIVIEYDRDRDRLVVAPLEAETIGKKDRPR